MATTKGRNLPEWGGGRSGFKTPATPARISRRNSNATAAAGIKGAQAKKK